MIIVEIGANAYEVQKDGKCLFAGTQFTCQEYLEKNEKKPAPKKTAVKTSKDGE